MIGVLDDLHLVMQLVSASGSRGFPERRRYVVATALVNPDDEEERSFLRRCALNEFDDRWVDAGAIQTLKLTASLRSRMILGRGATEELTTRRPDHQDTGRYQN